MDSKKDELSCRLIGSWTVGVGDMDQCIHLWQYTGGFEKIDQAKEELWHNEVMYFCHIQILRKYSYTILYF